MRRIPTLLTVLAILVLILLLTVVPAVLAQQNASPIALRSA